MKDCNSSSNKNCHLFSLQTIATFMWFPTIVTKNQGYLTSEEVLALSYLTAPQTPGLDPPLYTRIVILHRCKGCFIQMQSVTCIHVSTCFSKHPLWKTTTQTRVAI